MSEAHTTPRWNDYVLIRGGKENHEFRTFWIQHIDESDRSILFILGRGFDPRMCVGIKQILEIFSKGRIDVIALEFREGPNSPSLEHENLVNRNSDELNDLMQNRGIITDQPIEFWSSDGRRSSSDCARNLFGEAAEFDAYSDIVVDISAMPRSVYFPLVARILYLLDSAGSERPTKTNLHVIVSEDPDLDFAIRGEGIDEKAEFTASFVGGFDEEAIQVPKVWIPLLGRLRTTEFERIFDLVKPDEICPVFPFPSRNPRRADDIVIEYHQLLFDQHLLDPRSVLYASEQNPFEVYRQLRKAIIHYNEVFKLLDGCKIALSVLSSKTMSLGALLAAYELKPDYYVGVAHIECQGYTLESADTNTELVNLWLTGECYAA